MVGKNGIAAPAGRGRVGRNTMVGVAWRLLAVVILAPSVAAMVWVFPPFMKTEIASLWLHGARDVAVAFFAGVGVYLLLHVFLHRPITAYLFAHELVHELWVWLFRRGGRKSRAADGADRGRSGSANWVVRLAPYCLPLYALAWLGCWAGLEAAFPGLGRYRAVLFFGIGLLYAFHALLTLHFMKVGQSDLHAEGYLFSLSLILAVNLELAAAVYAAISHRASWVHFQRMVWECLLAWGGALARLAG
jgi:hypothetical protein